MRGGHECETCRILVVVGLNPILWCRPTAQALPVDMGNSSFQNRDRPIDEKATAIRDGMAVQYRTLSW